MIKANEQSNPNEEKAMNGEKYEVRIRRLAQKFPNSRDLLHTPLGQGACEFIVRAIHASCVSYEDFGEAFYILGSLPADLNSFMALATPSYMLLRSQGWIRVETRSILGHEAQVVFVTETFLDFLEAHVVKMAEVEA